TSLLSSAHMKTSTRLNVGTIYTREELASMFGITDATLFTGIFQPKGHESIWLFVTKDKTPDRTQYRNALIDDDLYMDGQTAGLKDALLTNHEQNGTEAILFFRDNRFQHPHGGFRYEGPFTYVSKEGRNPAHFHLRRVNPTVLRVVSSGDEI